MSCEPVLAVPPLLGLLASWALRVLVASVDFVHVVYPREMDGHIHT